MFKRALSVLIVAMVAIPVVVGISPSALASKDTYSSRQWGLKDINGEKAWATGKGKGVTVAVIDSGVDLKHEDLKGALVPGYDFVGNDKNPSDEFGHGTHVAGIVAARANNSIGVAGVAPEAKIMPIRVLDDSGHGSGAAIDRGVHWAVDHGADVINLSLSDDVLIEDLFGGSLTDSVNYAWSKGVVPVIAAGNDGFFRTEFKKANTLLVTAVGPDNAKASYANAVGFAKWGIAAPGGTGTDGKSSMVYSTIWTPGGKTHYGWAMGTSMAAPHVAGAAAVLRGLGLNAQQTVDRLLSTSRDIGKRGHDYTFGAGLLDVAAAVSGLRRPSRGPSAATASSVPDSSSTPKLTSGRVLPSATSHAQPSAGASATPGGASPELSDRVQLTAAPSARAIASGSSSNGRSAVPGAVAALLFAVLGAMLFGFVRTGRVRRRA